MSLPVPLTVRLSTGAKDATVTRQLRDLWFRETAIGGFASARMSLDRPLHVQPDELQPFGRVFVHDGRNGATVWEGRLEAPGRGVSRDGTVWEITAAGPAAHTLDRTVPLVYVDVDLTSMLSVTSSPVGGNHMLTTSPGTGSLALVLQFPTGLVIATNDKVVMQYQRINRAGMKLARVSFLHDAGINDVNEQIQAVAIENFSTTTWYSVNFSTTSATATGVVVTDWPDGRNVLNLQINRSAAAAAVPNDDYWASFRNLVVRAMLKDVNGNDITTGYTANTVFAHEVVKDLLGRLLTQYDGPSAVVADTTHTIIHLAYPDGVTPAKVLDDLLLLEPGYRWGAYESNPDTGRYRFEFVPWPTVVRYEADIRDGFDSPGSTADLYNRATVRFRAPHGEIVTVTRTSSVPDLTAAGLTREAFIDLGDDVGSSLNANRAGDQFLVEHAAAPNAGQLILARPVKDLVTGRTVMPWEIKAGELIRVRGVLPNPDSLNATTRDGVTVFRINAKEFSALRATAMLELDSYPLSVARALADVRRRPVTRRR